MSCQCNATPTTTAINNESTATPATTTTHNTHVDYDIKNIKNAFTTKQEQCLAIRQGHDCNTSCRTKCILYDKSAKIGRDTKRIEHPHRICAQNHKRLCSPSQAPSYRAIGVVATLQSSSPPSPCSFLPCCLLLPRSSFLYSFLFILLLF